MNVTSTSTWYLVRYLPVVVVPALALSTTVLESTVGHRDTTYVIHCFKFVGVHRVPGIGDRCATSTSYTCLAIPCTSTVHRNILTGRTRARSSRGARELIRRRGHHLAITTSRARCQSPRRSHSDSTSFSCHLPCDKTGKTQTKG